MLSVKQALEHFIKKRVEPDTNYIGKQYLGLIKVQWYTWYSNAWCYLEFQAKQPLCFGYEMYWSNFFLCVVLLWFMLVARKSVDSWLLALIVVYLRVRSWLLIFRYQMKWCPNKLEYSTTFKNISNEWLYFHITWTYLEDIKDAVGSFEVMSI